MKSKLKAPGTGRLKLMYENLLSNFAFKFNLRRYISALRFLTSSMGVGVDFVIGTTKIVSAISLVGRCRLTVSNPC